jgi:glycosyltransferase involved in cell wall biosynthesis
VHVIPFGPNLVNPPSLPAVLERIAARSRSECRLLFIGYDWERKQGPLVVKVHRELMRRGIPSHLTIIGCEPDLDRNRKGITVLGLLNKDVPAEEVRMKEELAKSHFLVVPSRAECYGMVYAEASAHGIPSIACNVGGVPTVVRPGRNGMLFEPEAPAAELADFIQNQWSDADAYAAMARNARHDYDDRLNWPMAVERLLALLDRETFRRH